MFVNIIVTTGLFAYAFMNLKVHFHMLKYIGYIYRKKNLNQKIKNM